MFLLGENFPKISGKSGKMMKMLGKISGKNRARRYWENLKIGSAMCLIKIFELGDVIKCTKKLGDVDFLFSMGVMVGNKLFFDESK